MFFKNLDYAAGYLSGLIDGEGWVSIPKNRYHNRFVDIANTDLEIIRAVEEALSMLGIGYSICRQVHKNPKWKPCYHVQVRNQYDLVRLHELCNLASVEKQSNLTTNVNSYQRWQDRTQFDKRQAKRLYTSGWSMEEIAQYLHVSHSRIQYCISGVCDPISQSEKAKRGWKPERRKVKSREKVADMYLNHGMSAAAIAKLLGVKTGTIIWNLKKAGAKLPPEEAAKRRSMQAKKNRAAIGYRRLSEMAKQGWLTRKEREHAEQLQIGTN